jgi:plastocyanin
VRARAARFAAFACTLLFFALASRASAATVNVEISAFQFRPDVLSITAGDTVTWTNRDSALHSVIFLTGLGQTENFGLGQSSSLRFLTPGTFQYICGLHGQSMSGSVTVRPADGPIEASGAAPTFVPPTPTPFSLIPARGADEAPVLPEIVTSSPVEVGRVAVFGGIGVLSVYLVARAVSLVRRK